MSRPSFGEGVLIALAAALLATLFHTGLILILPRGVALSLIVIGLGCGYLLYLLGRSRERAGRLVTVAVWMLITALVWSLLPGVWFQILTQVGLLWAVRAFYFHATPLAAVLDLALACVGLLAAIWVAQRTGSLFLAVWTLLLVQALFTAIPADPARGGREPETDPFDAAERAARRALRRLSLSD
ncbi:hypothetical protein [uncultured Thiocystis sp.]|jgi:hypothetical protein|uniref:hypothetical protein n=1 Tax=uncultured Thiocystis sp. TaxID=1202134 RepID=UPI0025DB66AE|nr:hypothetical protein [uncultured Thiocystis sp.]